MPTKLAKKCRECKYKDTCENKIMEEHAYLQPHIEVNVQNLTMPNMKKVDLRDIKIDSNTTLTIDMEELKERLTQSFHIGLGTCKKGGNYR